METDRVMTWMEVINSNGALNMRLARLAFAGAIALGLVIIPGSHKLAIVRVDRVKDDNGSSEQLQVVHYRDPRDPCFYDCLEPAPDDILRAVDEFSRQQLRVALDGALNQ